MKDLFVPIDFVLVFSFGGGVSPRIKNRYKVWEQINLSSSTTHHEIVLEVQVYFTLMCPRIKFLRCALIGVCNRSIARLGVVRHFSSDSKS